MVCAGIGGALGAAGCDAFLGGGEVGGGHWNVGTATVSLLDGVEESNAAGIYSTGRAMR
jgi:hypothetical protein